MRMSIEDRLNKIINSLKSEAKLNDDNSRAVVSDEDATWLVSIAIEQRRLVRVLQRLRRDLQAGK